MTTQPLAASITELFSTNLGELNNLIAAAKSAEDKAEHSVRQAGFKKDQGGYRLFTMFKKASAKEKPELIKLVEKALPEGVKINKATGAEGGIVKLLVGTVNWRVSHKLGLYEELYRDGIEPDDYVDHLNKVGEQNIKLARQARLRKEKGLDAEEPATTRTKALTKQQKADLVTRAKTELKDKPAIATAQATSVEATDGPIERVWICTEYPDGRLTFKARIADEQVIEAAYVSIGRSLPEETEEQRLARKAEELAKHPALNLTIIKAELGEDKAKELAKDWENEQACVKSLSEIPPELEEYQRLQKKSDFENNKQTDNGGDENALALEVLQDAKDAGVPVDVYLDRPFDMNTGIDTESMPRLRVSKSQHNENPLKRTKREALRAYCKAQAREIRSNIRSAPIDINPDPKKLMQVNRAMLDRVQAYQSVEQLGTEQA